MPIHDPSLVNACRILAGGMALALASALTAAPVKTAHVEAELVAAKTAIVPGEPSTIALRLAIEKGWHTYWRNPGDSGLPTTLTWKLPAGIEAGIGIPAAGIRRLLVLDHQGASRLKELLTDEPALPLAIDASAREVLTEVGNILLNACLGTFGNLLHVQVSFSVPHLTLETLEGVVSSITVDREGLRYAMIVHAAFRLKNSSLAGYLVIVLSVASIERLIQAIEQWERDQR